MPEIMKSEVRDFGSLQRGAPLPLHVVEELALGGTENVGAEHLLLPLHRQERLFGHAVDIPLLVEHFRVRCNRDDQLAVDGFSRHALALLEADPWPGNVRELGAVVRRAMAVRRRGVVGAEDVTLPALRRAPAAPAATIRVAVPVTAATLNRYEVEALRLAAAGGGVRRGALMVHCGISREAARRTLALLVELGLLRRLGSGRGSWYVLRTPDDPGG
jgi:hypothetical protein